MIVTVGVVVVALVVVILAIEVAKRTKHPEQTAGHGRDPDDTTSDRFYRGVDRPAGPDAEEPLPPAGGDAG